MPPEAHINRGVVTPHLESEAFRLPPLDQAERATTTTGASMLPTAHRRPPAAAIVLVPVVVAIVLTLLAWPTARLQPRDVPVGVAGAPAAAEAIEQRLGQDGAFAVHRYADAAAARRAIEDRDIYGAFVLTPAGPEVLIASAASTAVAQLLNHAAVEGRAGPARVRDVVPAPPAAGAFAALLLPLIIAGTLTGLAATALASGALRRTGLLATGSILVGLTATAIVHSWLDVVGGDWAANAAALSLAVLAMASLVAGLEALLGRAGTIIAALTLILIGNPLSGAAASPELLPQPTGAIGQLLPPGAGANLLRSTGFFEGASAGEHIIVLSAWAIAGLAAIFLAATRTSRPAGSARAQGPLRRRSAERAAPSSPKTASASRRASPSPASARASARS